MAVSIAFIPLMKPATLSQDAIVADFAAKWPGLPAPESAPTKDGMVGFAVGADQIIVATMPAPIPWSDLEGPCQASWLWPDAESALRGHEEHLIVTLLSEAGPVDRAGMLTRVCASVLATCAEAPGVYWGDAGLVIPSAIFREFAAEILPEGPPLFIWVDFRVGPSKPGRSRGFTAGMVALGHMEFETEDASETPGELRERFHALAQYVLENGPIIKDGDTIGEDAQERIRVVYAPSAFGHEGQVMRLEYDAPQRRKSWFRLWK